MTAPGTIEALPDWLAPLCTQGKREWLRVALKSPRLTDEQLGAVYRAIQPGGYSLSGQGLDMATEADVRRALVHVLDLLPGDELALATASEATVPAI